MMYEMGKGNCSLSEEALLSVPPDNSSKTPNTPEILSALSKLHPLDEYMTRRSSVTDDKIFSPSEYNSADTCSSTSSNIGSPSSPVSLQNMRSQLIKEDLKMRLRQKAREKSASISVDSLPVATPCSSLLSGDDSYLDLDENDGNSSNGDSCKTSSELTAEDQERRSRRRERNKLAAWKCREKKRQRTKCLEDDSVKLEEQNRKMKYDIEKLKTQKRKLVVLLNDHKPSCLEPSPDPSPIKDIQQPPTFAPHDVANSALVNDVDKTVLHQCQNEVASSNSVLSNMFDFNEQFLKNSSITLPVPENISYHGGRHSINHLPQQTLLDSNLRYNVPSLGFLDEANNNYYDISYVDGAENGCMV